jgi:predicted acylesterase/phospholipase RssA
MGRYPADPPLDCDVIMKGGITSGVIYPLAVCELAKVYRLRSVGGASAGAIAAAAAAAAEYGRAAGGFEALEQVPTGLTAKSGVGGSVLFRLFQPDARTAGLFAVVTAGAGRSGIGRLVAVLGALLCAFAGAAGVGAVPGIVVLVVGSTGAGASAARLAAVSAGVVLLAVGGLLGAAVGALGRVGAVLPDHGFGLCSGMPGTRRFRPAEALTPWLHRTLQQLAGREPDAPPLTFGDLASRGCDLRMMTTNLTRRQPVAMPWRNQEYFSDPARFRTLFPADVVQWMVDHPPAVTGARADRWNSALLRAQALPLVQLPPAEDLPVVVATRMSLSFPLLIAAVGLHAVDYSLESNQAAAAAADRWRAEHRNGSPEEAVDAVARRRFAVNWFSDGGICSNLPVHFFDRPLPLRPTFAIDLAPFPAGQAKSECEADNTSLPVVNQAGLLRRWTSWPTTGLGGMAAFGGAILGSARSWVDESLLGMPGYRDRVVTIYHDDAEGGLNLAMEPPVVASLSARGQAGAAKLVTRFAGPAPGVEPAAGWENQRWVRFRTATAGLSYWVGSFRGGYSTDPPGATPYRDLAGPGAAAPLPSYRLTTGRRNAVNDRTGDLLGLAERWAGAHADAFTAGAPAPTPVLRLVPGQKPEELAPPPSDA